MSGMSHGVWADRAHSNPKSENDGPIEQSFLVQYPTGVAPETFIIFVFCTVLCHCTSLAQLLISEHHTAQPCMMALTS